MSLTLGSDVLFSALLNSVGWIVTGFFNYKIRCEIETMRVYLHERFVTKHDAHIYFRSDNND